VSFSLHDASGAPFTFTSEEMQDTQTVLHGYVYEGVPPLAAEEPEAPDAAPDPLLVAAETGGLSEMADLEIGPELAGASEGAVPLTGDRTPAKVTMQMGGLGRLTEGVLAPSVRVYLRLENVRGTGVPADYDVVIDLEGDGVPPIAVGILSTFGVANASDPESDHGGEGLTQVFDISDAAERLKLTDGTAAELNVSFLRVAQGAVSESAMPLMEGLSVEGAAEAEPSIEIGRIGVYFE
jgi:tyrosinase